MKDERVLLLILTIGRLDLCSKRSDWRMLFTASGKAVTRARRSAQRHHLGTSIGDADLEIAVRVLLLEHYPNRLLHVNEEPPWRTRNGLLVMG